MKRNYFTSTVATIRVLFAGLILFTAFSGKAQCMAGFTSTSNGNVVNFTSTSTTTTSNSYYYWNFGDGNYAWGVTTAHTFTSGSMSAVCLMLIDSTINCWDTECDSVYYGGNPSNPCNPSVVFSLAKDTTQALTWMAYPNYPLNTTAASWSWGDGSTTTGLYPSHTYTSAGTYTICVTVSVTCPNSTSVATAQYCYVGGIYRVQSPQDNGMIKLNVMSAPTGIKAQVKAGDMLNIYPNPGSGLFTIEFGDAAQGQHRSTVYVYNMLGEVVLEKSISTGVKESIDLGKFDNGNYFVKLVSDNGYTTKKISVQK
ncbi:MAG: PKD domain-containing protein [Bacteroidota bacterium]